MGGLRVSDKMRAALEKASSSKGLGSWETEAGTLGALKRRGWVERRNAEVDRVASSPRYFITDAGKKAMVCL
jgi:hypothetical protein